jgi:hypothetical protein
MDPLTMTFSTDRARLERDWGIHVLAQDWMPDEFRSNYSMALDAQPGLLTTANAGVPALFTTYQSPEVVRVLQAPNKGAEILGERKMGTWTTRTAVFSVIENVGEVAAYGDRNANGRSNTNAGWPQRQSFHFQTVIEYGDMEVDMAGEAKLNWVAEQQTSAAKTLNKFNDYIYHFGVTGLQNYGLTNDPALPAAVTPVTKSEVGLGTSWGSTGLYASPNEIFNDFQIMFNDLVTRTYGTVTSDDALTFVCTPGRQAALLSTNSFGLSAIKMIKDAFPNLKIKVSPRYLISATEHAQLIADTFDGNNAGYCAFTEKLRDHPVVRQLSSFQQKKTAGSWGAVLLYPIAVTTITGI